MRHIVRVVCFALLTNYAISQQSSPPLSTEPLSTERLNIYREFLKSYSNGSGTVLNVSNKTAPLFWRSYDERSCLSAFSHEDLDGGKHVIHTFAEGTFPSKDVRLIDPDRHKKNDPGEAIKRGSAVGDAVLAGFAAGVFTFSEIVFDAPHTHAAFSYSFICGGLCGHGGVVIFELHNEVWSSSKLSKLTCGNWIS